MVGGASDYEKMYFLFQFPRLRHQIDISAVCTSMGFEVGIGFLHAIQSQRPSLACDFLELYRPLIDQFVIRLFNRGEIAEDDFEKDGEGVLLKRKQFGPFMKKYDTFRPPRQSISQMVNELNQALKKERVPHFGEEVTDLGSV